MAEAEAAEAGTSVDADFAEGGEVYVGVWISIFSSGRIPVYVGISRYSRSWIWLWTRPSSRERERERQRILVPDN